MEEKCATKRGLYEVVSNEDKRGPGQKVVSRVKKGNTRGSEADREGKEKQMSFRKKWIIEEVKKGSQIQDQHGSHNTLNEGF